MVFFFQTIMKLLTTTQQDLLLLFVYLFISLKKWPSSRQLNGHLAKSLVVIRKCDRCVI